MSWILLTGLVVGGLAVAAFGLWLMRNAESQNVKPLVRPVVVDKTDARGRDLVIDRWIFLALELCRVDGAIDESEIAAIERNLGDSVIGLDPDAAAAAVHRALRATIREANMAIALGEIAVHADREHRAFVVRTLKDIASADGKISRDEQLFLDQVQQELGPS